MTARGNGRQAIHLDRDDRLGFLALLQQCVNRFGWLVHTHCLMGNHFHLLIETPLANLARGMRQLNGVYAQTFNRRHGTVGHLFQARYGARLVQRERHGLAVVRYIVRNPVRAGLCEHPGEWPWSSYNATAGHEHAPEFLTTDWVLGQLGSSLGAARERFRRFVLDGPELDPAIADLYQGDPAFAEEHAPARPIPEIPRRRTMPVRPAARPAHRGRLARRNRRRLRARLHARPDRAPARPPLHHDQPTARPPRTMDGPPCDNARPDPGRG